MPPNKPKVGHHLIDERTKALRVKTLVQGHMLRWAGRSNLNSDLPDLGPELFIWSHTSEALQCSKGETGSVLWLPQSHQECTGLPPGETAVAQSCRQFLCTSSVFFRVEMFSLQISTLFRVTWKMRREECDFLLIGVCTHSSARLADSCTPEAQMRAEDWNQAGPSALRLGRIVSQLALFLALTPRQQSQPDIRGSDPRFQVFFLHV